MQTLKPVAVKFLLTLCATAWVGATLPTAFAGDDGSAQAWSEQPGFQRGQGTPADTGAAGEKCQDIDDANRKTECVRKARIKTKTSVKKKEIEQEAEQQQKAVEKKAAEAKKKAQQAQ